MNWSTRFQNTVTWNKNDLRKDLFRDIAYNIASLAIYIEENETEPLSG